MSSTVHLEDGFQFRFWLNEGSEPPHVHVTKGEARAKWWPDPVREHQSDGFKPSQRNRIRGILHEHQDAMLERSHETFGTTEGD